MPCGKKEDTVDPVDRRKYEKAKVKLEMEKKMTIAKEKGVLDKGLIWIMANIKYEATAEDKAQIGVPIGLLKWGNSSTLDNGSLCFTLLCVRFA